MILKTFIAIIIYGFGLNCDFETEYVLKKAGFETQKRHLNELIENPELLNKAHLLVLPGGFAHGDAIEAGSFLALTLRTKLDKALKNFINEKKLIIGICNGAQVLVKYPLLPQVAEKENATITLSSNESGKFENRWVKLKINPNCPCLFT